LWAGKVGPRQEKWLTVLGLAVGVDGMDVIPFPVPFNSLFNPSHLCAYFKF
jgi:hypothetical protein